LEEIEVLSHGNNLIKDERRKTKDERILI
jgi:hypothetical protein